MAGGSLRGRSGPSQLQSPPGRTLDTGQMFAYSVFSEYALRKYNRTAVK